jgi:hypothetical protein
VARSYNISPENMIDKITSVNYNDGTITIDMGNEQYMTLPKDNNIINITVNDNFEVATLVISAKNILTQEIKETTTKLVDLPIAFRNIGSTNQNLRVITSEEGANSGGRSKWAFNANTCINAFIVGNGAKTELLDYAVRTNYKSARTVSQFNKLRSTQQAWRTTNTLGKTGAQYLKYAKGLGYVGAGLTTTYSAYNAGSYYYNGGTDWQVGTKATLDVIMTGVGFLGPIGFGISATYFIVDATGCFGDFGEIKP